MASINIRAGQPSQPGQRGRKMEKALRDSYSNLISYPDCIREILSGLDNQAWSTGIDRKHSQSMAINTEVISYDETKILAVVQVRQCIFKKRYNVLHKNYYLIGRNENGNFFAHPIKTIMRNKTALKTIEGGVALALSRIWNCSIDELSDIVRNGDVAFIPIGKIPAEAKKVSSNAVIMGKSHKITGDLWHKGTTVYIKGRGKITHTKGQHPTAVALKGCNYRVQMGVRFEEWNFSQATSD